MAATAASAEASQPRVERILSVDAFGSATNGYSFQFHAYRVQPGGAAASIQVSSSTGSVSYFQSRPLEVSKRRIVADFGEVGSVDVRFDSQFSAPPGGRGRCVHQSFSAGVLRGTFSFEGENGFTAFRSKRTRGYAQSVRIDRRCSGDHRRGTVKPIRFARSSILSSCGGEAGAGFFAVEIAPEAEPFFLASKSQRDGSLTTIRTLEVSGAARRFDVAGPRSARIVPPEPFAGRARYSSGDLAGNLTVDLPGTGRVRLTPGAAELARGIDDFRPPKCFPLLYLRSPAGSANGRIDPADAMMAEAAAKAILPPRLRRLLGH